ncbi:NAD-dependent epimerase/dehydratase family protein [soil metagenome]
MRVLLLGGTGSIGSAVLRELVGRRHEVVALARSDASAAKIQAAGGVAVAGDIATPTAWIRTLPSLDAVIHMACDFKADMAAVDRQLLDALLPYLAVQRQRARLIYTGGGWLFGATGDRVATESSPFAPLPAFAWMVPHLQRVLASPGADGIVIHPAMVHGGDGGVFRRFADDAASGRPVRVVGGEDVRWPLVHREDLAVLYALALERAPPRSSWLGVDVEGLAVGRIARSFSAELEIVPADAIAAELGEWARGYGCDQQLSGAKARRDLGWEPARELLSA